MRCIALDLAVLQTVLIKAPLTYVLDPSSYARRWALKRIIGYKNTLQCDDLIQLQWSWSIANRDGLHQNHRATGLGYLFHSVGTKNGVDDWAACASNPLSSYTDCYPTSVRSDFLARKPELHSGWFFVSRTCLLLKLSDGPLSRTALMP